VTVKPLHLLILVSFLLGAPPVEDSLFHYRAHATDVYDGDTVTVDMDLGMQVWLRHTKLRLYGIDTPELRPRKGTPEEREAEKKLGLAARDYVRTILLKENRLLIVETYRDKKGKYGRWLAVLWVSGKDGWCALGSYCNLNEHLVASGHAVHREY
jgi:micrococcal nuclease